MESRIKEALKILGYTEDWIKTGVITEEFLLEQLDEFEKSEDKNQEHYRGGGFYHYISTVDKLSDDDIDNIFQLKDNGPDNCDLHLDRIIELIHSEKLTDHQLESIEKYPDVNEAPIQKRYKRSKALRSLKKSGLTVEHFDLLKDTTDFALHEFVLDMDDLTREHLLWLSENGLNKRVRNISKQMLNSKLYRG